MRQTTLTVIYSKVIGAYEPQWIMYERQRTT